MAPSRWAYLSCSTIVILLSYYKANPPPRQHHVGVAAARWTDPTKSEIRNLLLGDSVRRRSLSLTTNEKPPHS